LAIKVYGKRTLPLNLCGQCFEGEFIVAEVRHAILGADFLRASGLLVDMAGECLIHAATYAVVNATAVSCSTVNVAYAVHAVDLVYAKLLAEFPTLTSVNFSTRIGVVNRHGLDNADSDSSLEDGDPVGTTDNSMDQQRRILTRFSTLKTLRVNSGNQNIFEGGPSARVPPNTGRGG
jgi:hypothetical protein